MNEVDAMIEETRRVGIAYFESFGGDLDAVFADLKRRSEDAKREGLEVVSLPPRRPRRPIDVVADAK